MIDEFAARTLSFSGHWTRNCTPEERVRNLELILVRPDEISTFDVRMEVKLSMIPCVPGDSIVTASGPNVG